MKKETIISIKNLESGYVLTKDFKENIGLSNETQLEAKVTDIIKKYLDVQQICYFTPKKNVKITITVEHD